MGKENEIKGKAEKPVCHKPKGIVIRFKTKEHGKEPKEFQKELVIPMEDDKHLSLTGTDYCTELPNKAIGVFLYSEKKNQMALQNEGPDTWIFVEPGKKEEKCRPQELIKLYKGIKIEIRKNRMFMIIDDIIY